MHEYVRRQPRWSVLAVVLAALLAWAPSAGAQGFDADRYLAQCLRFEAGGDYTSAREACRNALQIDEDRADIQLALARIDVELGAFASAESRLMRLVRDDGGAEASLLLARIALEEGRLLDAEGHLEQARVDLEGAPDRTLAARYDYLHGRVLEARGQVRDALDAYGEAVSSDGLEVEYRLADARLRFLLGDAAGARAQLEAYQALSGDSRDPRVRSLLGRVMWAQGNLVEAGGQLETALALWSNLDVAEQASDLRTLGFVYLGRGELGRGTLALREAGRRGNQSDLLNGNVLLWLLLALALLVVHLLGESRIESRSTLEVVEGPQPWTVGDAYGIVLLSVAVAAVTGLTMGVLMYDNLLAVVTPHQATETRAVMAAVFALVALLLTGRSVRRHGWQTGPRLLGQVDTWAAGVGVGLGLLAVTLAYLSLRPDAASFSGLWLNVSRLSPAVLAAVVVLPLAELTFRPYAFDALEYRYDSSTALFLSAALSTLVLATPVLLLLPFGLLMAELYRRTRSGTMLLSAQLTLHVGLVVAVLVSPWARALFL
ncbi:MAG: tetratricopeptide repeat protein [Trueperaceae bacterium]|nr:tetratricopeptide repeat protein [Trueperaceae bacterium]